MIPRFYTNAVATEHYLGIRWPVAIWRAVLEQAVRDIVEGPQLFETKHLDIEARPEYRHAVRCAAVDWLYDDTDEPRRFVWVCDILNIEPTAVRRSIEKRLA